jgi:hypothetical protein
MHAQLSLNRRLPSAQASAASPQQLATRRMWGAARRLMCGGNPATPLRASRPPVRCRWCPSRPCAFLALAINGTLWGFDLLAPTAAPLVLRAPSSSDDSCDGGRPCSLEFLASPAASAAVAAAAADTPAHPPRGQQQGIYAIGYSDGRVGCHALPRGLREARDGERGVLQQLVV